MSVHRLLSVLVRHDDLVLDPVVLENVWMLAERSSDLDTMVAIVSRQSPVPVNVLSRALTRKEFEVRVAYLCRVDLDPDERMRLLATEKRADVFAGLLKSAAGNVALADRIVERFRAKPTKVLARTILREDFDHDGVSFDCLLVLAAEKQMPDWLDRKLRCIVVDSQENQGRCHQLARVLPPVMLPLLNLATLDPASVVLVVERFSAFASAEHDSRIWEVGAAIRAMSENLVSLAAGDALDQSVVVALDEVSSAPWFEPSEQLAALIAGRRTTVDPDDDLRRQARTARGVELERLISVSVASRDPDRQRLLGLLENPCCYDTAGFADLVEKCQPALLVSAVHETRSPDLMLALWRKLGNGVPEICWTYLDDPASLIKVLVAEVLENMRQSGDMSPYGFNGVQLNYLLCLGVTEDVVASLPFELIESGTRWRHNSLFEAVAGAVLSLQVKCLGSDVHVWENFNNLAFDWSGTYGELLEAAKAL